MKKIIAIIKDYPRRWKAETPKLAKWIRNVAATITAANIATLMGSLLINGIVFPIWFSQIVGSVILVSGIITAVAGAKEKK